MKNNKGNIIIFFLIVGVSFLAFFLFFMNILGKGCSTASKMADQTVFNADKHVYSYENFYDMFTKYEQYGKLFIQAEESLKNAQKDERSALIMQRDGARQMMNNIAGEYNKASKIFYQSIWKSKNLPENLY